MFAAAFVCMWMKWTMRAWGMAKLWHVHSKKSWMNHSFPIVIPRLVKAERALSVDMKTSSLINVWKGQIQNNTWNIKASANINKTVCIFLWGQRRMKVNAEKSVWWDIHLTYCTSHRCDQRNAAGAGSSSQRGFSFITAIILLTKGVSVSLIWLKINIKKRKRAIWCGRTTIIRLTL